MDLINMVREKTNTKEELKPVLFDSHYAYDTETETAFYVHFALRNSSLTYEVMGTSGICRSPTIGMPLFHANTNRFCTRYSKYAQHDSPTYPVYNMKTASNNFDYSIWPFTQEYIEKTFESEYCSESENETPWVGFEDDILSQTVGSIPGWSLFTSMDPDNKVWYDSMSKRSYPPQYFDHDWV